MGRKRQTATTSVKIPARTKARIARAAKEAGVTVHAYLLEAIERAAARADRRREFDEVHDEVTALSVRQQREVDYEEQASTSPSRS